jgi:Zn-dependent protease
MNFLGRLMHPELILYSLPGILIGLVLHELAHAFVADRLGDPTPRMMGRLTLNPLPHIDPVGLLMLIIAGFGWAKPVITNPSRYKIKRYGFALVGFAGPLTNLVLGFLMLGIYVYLGTIGQISTENVFMTILNYAVAINFALFAFNLIPIPPLDGYNILKDILLIKNIKSKILWNIERYGQFALLILLFTGIAGAYIGFVTNLLWNGEVSLFTRLFL